MITVGLALALGARASASLVRDGSGAARVQALFDPREGAEEWVDDDALLLSRSVSSDGRGTCRGSAGSSRRHPRWRRSEGHSSRSTASTRHSGSSIPRFRRPSSTASPVTSTSTRSAAYREVYDELRRARAAFDELREATRERERELDLLAYQTREIEAVMPRPGESDELVAEEARLGHIERLLEAGGAAEAALSGDHGAADDALGIAASALDEAAALDPGAGAIAGRAAALAAESAELARDVRIYRESLAPDPERLQMVRERMLALKGLQRKYGETDADVLGFLAEASSRLQELQGADERLIGLSGDVEALAERASELGSTISRGRRDVAGRLAGAIERELGELGMPGAAVDVALEPSDGLGPGGAERVELRFAGAPGQPSAALAKTASGGELSRTMLACRSVMADLDDVPTLVFDEVDAGIGGRAGLAVGRRLAMLARDRQVLVVSHLPQIACFADRHLRVTKHDGTAAVEVLDDAARVAELSRMLAGLERSAGAVSHAEELLDEASRVKAGA